MKTSLLASLAMTLALLLPGSAFSLPLQDDAAPPAENEGDPPKPAPPEGKPPTAPVPAGAGRGTRVPLTVERAHTRLLALRRAPMRGPGSLVKRRTELAALAGRTLKLPELQEASGAQLFQVGEILVEGEFNEEAESYFRRYLEIEGEKKFHSEASMGLIRSLATRDLADKTAKAMATFEKEQPESDLLPVSGKLLGDCLVRAGRHTEAIKAYETAIGRCPPDRDPGIKVSLVQSLTSVQMADGDLESVRTRVTSMLETAPASLKPRLTSILDRANRIGQPFVPPNLPHWNGKQPEAGDLKGRVVVWHIFSWWMASRLDELSAWSDLAAREDLLVIPVTRTTGWDAKTRSFKRGRDPEEELKDIAAMLTSLGFEGPSGVGIGRNSFDSMGVRGIPTEVVVDREGNVRFMRASGEVGSILARRVAEALLAENSAEDGGTEPGAEPSKGKITPPSEPEDDDGEGKR